MISAAAALVTLVLTVPSTNAYVEGDSIFLCEGGLPTADVAWIRFMRQDVTGGPLYAFDSLDVHGKEGQEVTEAVDPGPGAHFYAQAIDTAGEASCFSDGVYIPGYVTGVGDGPPSGEPISVRWFSINGWVDKPMASGIYWKVETYADKRRVRKVVILR